VIGTALAPLLPVARMVPETSGSKGNRDRLEWQSLYPMLCSGLPSVLPYSGLLVRIITLLPNHNMIAPNPLAPPASTAALQAQTKESHVPRSKIWSNLRQTLTNP
jgi:hypothetical protein